MSFWCVMGHILMQVVTWPKFLGISSFAFRTSQEAEFWHDSAMAVLQPGNTPRANLAGVKCRCISAPLLKAEAQTGVVGGGGAFTELQRKRVNPTCGCEADTYTMNEEEDNIDTAERLAYDLMKMNAPIGVRNGLVYYGFEQFRGQLKAFTGESL